MQLIKRTFTYAFLLWLVPFLLSVAIFPIKKTDPAFFQSLMTVISALFVVILSIHYFRKTQGNLKEGIFLGVIFLVVSLFFDFFFFIWGPIKMPLISYVKEIAVGYLIYPIITIGFGYALRTPKIDKA